MRKIVVRWSLEDSKPKGKVVPHDGTPPARKIVFVDRRWSGQLVEGSLWECGLLCDTKPSDPRRGALIVRPLRPLTWDWTDVGEPLWNVHERALRCVEYPGIDGHFGPIHDAAYYERRSAENVPWHAAQERQSLWEGALWGHADAFWATFGQPTAVRPGAEGRTLLVYPHGEKQVQSASLAESWPIVAAGAIRQQGTSLEAEFRFAPHPDCGFWGPVGQLGSPDAWSPPHVLSHFAALSEDLQDRVLEMLRASAVAPETMASVALAQRLASLGDGCLAKQHAEIAALLAPDAEITCRRHRGTICSPESNDGYRPALQYEAWFMRHELCAGGTRFEVGDIQEYLPQPQLDIEKERRRLIAERWQRIEDGLRLSVPDYPEHGTRILGVALSAWVRRYTEAWTAAVAEHRRVLAIHACEALDEVLRNVEWSAFLEEVPSIEVAEDATELPPLETRPLSHQVAYGVVSIETLWSGARYHTRWYRDELDAVAEHTRAVEEAAPLLARRNAARQSNNPEKPSHDRYDFIDPDAPDDVPAAATHLAAPPAVAAAPTSLSDLKAKFNRRRAS